MSILVMLNNYFHDFAVAVLVACLLVYSFIERRSREAGFERIREFSHQLYVALRRVLIAAWIVIIVGGVIRTVTYADYEWSEAAGRGQVTALVVKHILLVSLIVWGIILQRRLRRRLQLADRRIEVV